MKKKNSGERTKRLSVSLFFIFGKVGSTLYF